jgi:putative sterol carrier protein
MADATALFFDELAQRGHEPLLGGAVGSVRFELVAGSHVDAWRVTLEDGDVSVSRDESAADCVVRADKVLFDGIATGQVNAMTAQLRGALTFEGDPELLVRLQRIFPPPPAGQVPASGAERR